VQVIAIVLIPVGIGMTVRSRSQASRARRQARADLLDRRPGARVDRRAARGAGHIAGYVEQVGLVTGLFCLISLTLGYSVARVLKLDQRQAIATSMEVGIHNTTIALTIALSVLTAPRSPSRAPVYSVLMYLLATAFGYTITRSRFFRAADQEPVR
jgi:BASS family bile acid:Na+ symporter